MQSKLSDKDRLMGGSQKHQSSVTFADFSERDGANFIKEWISSRLDGRVRTSQSQDTAQGSRARGQDCGRKHLNVCAYLDPDGVSWRTPQQSFLDEGLTEYVGTWPRSAIMCGGMLSAVPSRAHRISGNDGGLWPTPTVDSALNRTGKYQQGGTPLPVAVRWPTPRASDTEGGTVSDVELEDGSFSRRNSDGVRWGVKLRDAAENFPDVQARWPTPISNDAKKASPKSKHFQGLVDKVNEVEGIRWPTPTTAEGGKIGNRPNYGQVGLSNHPDIVGTPDREPMEKSRARDGQSTWPTPTSTQYKGWSPDHNRADTDDRLDYTVGREGDYENSELRPKARLNPTFVEWLMNVPEGWSSLDPVSAEDYNDWFNQTIAGTFWNAEKGPRVDVNIPQRAKRLILLGNGIVPRTLALFLRDRIRDSELNSSDV